MELNYVNVIDWILGLWTHFPVPSPGGVSGWCLWAAFVCLQGWRCTAPLWSLSYRRSLVGVRAQHSPARAPVHTQVWPSFPALYSASSCVSPRPAPRATGSGSTGACFWLLRCFWTPSRIWLQYSPKLSPRELDNQCSCLRGLERERGV